MKTWSGKRRHLLRHRHW